jgi:quercetin dioxygenase-like cupin family protein
MTVLVNPAHSFAYVGARYNVYHANIGEGLPRHEHTFKHATFCSSGSCKVSLEGRSYTITKYSQPLDLPANQWHEIEALEDNTVFTNIFSEETH